VTKLPSIISDSLLQLTEDQLVQLHAVIVERLRLFRSAKHLRAMSEFNLGDMVSFEYNGQKIMGTITRLNQKSVSLITLDGKPWKVSPQLLSKIQGV
jgi:hypothetical protein